MTHKDLDDIDILRRMYATLCGGMDDALTLLEAGRGDTRELFASNLAGSLRSRLQQHSLPQLSPADFASEAEFDQAYDKAFAEYSQNVVEDVQVDEEQELAVRCGVMSIPTVIFFKNGQEIGRKVGVMGDKVFSDVLDANI